MENIFNEIKFGPDISTNLTREDIEDCLAVNNSLTTYEIDTYITVIEQPDCGQFIVGEDYLIVDVDYSDNTLLLVDEDNFDFWVDFSDVQY